MTPVEGREPYEEGAAGLARVARALDGRVDEPSHAAGRERLLSALTRRSRPSAARRLLLLAATLALVAVVGIGGVVWQRKPAQLEYRVAGPVLTDGIPWLGVAPSGGPLAMRFSDGTEVDLGPGSKGRVAEVTADGASVVLGAGMLQARVVHRPHTHWTVAAGPYTIEVTGTAFDVGWSTAGEELGPPPARRERRRYPPVPAGRTSRGRRSTTPGPPRHRRSAALVPADSPTPRGPARH